MSEKVTLSVRESAIEEVIAKSCGSYKTGGSYTFEDVWNCIEAALSDPVLAASAGQVEQTAAARIDALCDSAYCAGLQAAFSLGQSDNNDGLAKALASRDGYVGVLRETRVEQTAAAREIIEARRTMLARSVAVRAMDRRTGDKTIYDGELARHRACIFEVIDAEIERIDRAAKESNNHD